jgi:hypothetical protein
MNLAASASQTDPILVGNILLRADAIVGRWMSDRMGVDFEVPYAAMGILGQSGQLEGGVIFNGFNEADVEVTLYAPRRLSRALFRVICSYAFETLECNRMTARTRASSLVVRRVLTGTGFQEEGMLRRYYKDGEDAVLYGMTKEDCRWLRPQPSHPPISVVS